MNIKLIKAWIKVGSPPLEDFGPAIGLTDVEVIRFFNGQREPDQQTKYVLADIFECAVRELWPEE